MSITPNPAPRRLPVRQARPGDVTSDPTWSPITRKTADLLALVGDTRFPSTMTEWQVFCAALDLAADLDDVVSPNYLRGLVRGRVAPKRIGAFTSAAKARGILVATGDWEISDDAEGRNAGRPAQVYRLDRARLAAESGHGEPTPLRTSKKRAPRSEARVASTAATGAAVLPVWDREPVSGGLF